MRLAFLLIFTLTFSTAYSQLYNDYEEGDYYDSDFNRDSIPELDSLITVDNSADPSGFKKIFSGRPGRAAKYSLMIPGWGQIYNGKIWKVPLVYGLEGTAIYFLIDNRRKFRNFDTCYTGLIEGTSPETCSGIVNVSDAFVVRQAFRKRRELSYVFIIGAHLLQAFEAYIDRHLVDFDIDEDLSFRPFVAPVHTSGELTIAGLYYNLSPIKKAATPKKWY